MSKIVRRFIAGNHRCWFSKKYPELTVNEVLDIDPEYIYWCKNNLHHLRFGVSLSKRINKKYRLKTSETINP